MLFGISYFTIGMFVFFVVAMIFAWGLFIGPVWNVWASHKAGQADLMQAKNEQQIQVAKAQGRVDAAQLNKQASIIEAQGVSESINIIGATLTQHDLYLRWQWIKMMEEQDTKSTVIYVPTEGNIPVMEASRLKKN